MRSDNIVLHMLGRFIRIRVVAVGSVYGVDALAVSRTGVGGAVWCRLLALFATSWACRSLYWLSYGSGMTGAVVCGSGMLRAGLVDGRRTAFLAPVWDVGSVSTLCAGPAAVALLRVRRLSVRSSVILDLY